MAKFPMCEECEKEYHNPLDRRFHAQPNACPKCGPHISLYSSKGEFIAEKEKALHLTVELLKQGKILALKGLGEFHIAVLAENCNAVKELRKRKKRKAKPFAVMFPNLRQLEDYVEISENIKKFLHPI